MATSLIIAGKSNTGKSTMIRDLDPKSTFIINCLGKNLPFQGSKVLYNKENGNIGSYNGYEKVVNALIKISADLPNVKTIVIDDAGYIINTELMDRADEKNFDKHTALAQHMFMVLNTISKLRDDLRIILMFHQEDLDDLNQTADIKIPSKMMKNYYHPAELTEICVFTNVEYNDDDTETYNLVVNKTKKYPLAKTPAGMFKEKVIPANLNVLLDTINSYNNKIVN
jgi:hypothetical protein